MSITQSRVTGLLVVVAVLAIAIFAIVAFAPSAQAAYSFATNLRQGSTGGDVMNLQIVLNRNAATQVSTSGAGAPGSETSYFGVKTKGAVIKFQEMYASEILAPNGLTSGTGFVGVSTRAKLNAMEGGTTSSTVPGCTSTAGFSPTTGQKCDSTVTTVPSTGGALSVSSASQPANALAVGAASRVPFTRVTLTAGSNDVSVSNITVERVGPAVDAVFTGIALLDEDGTQIGIAKTLNSNHQVAVGDPFTVRAGTSKTVTIAANMTTQAIIAASYAGQVVGIQVNAVNTNGTVSGSLPITGAFHTLNGSLAIGNVTNSISSFDPNSTQSKEIGTTNFKFAGIRITAGSAEQIRIRSIRWNQTGSVGSSDLANVKTYFDGVAYDTTVSSDGKYYNTNFGSGIVVDKGLGKDIYVQGDIVGGSSAGRTVKFDIYKSTDVYITGETYGYGITPPVGAGTADNATSEFTAGTPWFDGSLQNVSAGSVTTVSKASSIAAQNIAVNVPNQVLGGYEIDLKGEPISVQSHIFTIASTTPAGVGTAASVITSVSLYGPNGNVVAGPVDAVVTVSTDVGYGVSTQKVTFTDTVTYPIGKGVYTLKGKVPSSIGNGSTYAVSTVPSTQWTTVTGQTTGNTISLSTLSTSVAMNTMTVKAAALAITVSSAPSAQTITAGTGKTFANYQFDASQSGEDVRFSSIPLQLTYAGTPGAVGTSMSACQLYDGTTPLNTGSNVVNGSTVVTPQPKTFTLDQPLTITKGTVKTVTLKCNLANTVAGNTFSWGIAASPSITVTGVTSSNDVTETVVASVGATQTIGAGALTVAKDSSSPSYAVVAGGSTGVNLGSLRFHAANEAITLERVAFQLTNTASSSPASLVQVTLWDGAIPVGTVTFTGNNYNATSTLTGTFTVPKDGDKIMTLKGDLGTVGTGLATSSSGALVAVDFDGLDIGGTRGTGVDSGTTINTANAASPDTAMDGVRIMKSYPTLARIALNSATLIAQAGIDLYRFSVTANSTGDVAMNKVLVNVATSSDSVANGTTTVTNLLVKAYTDSGFSSIVPGYTDGQVVATITGLVENGNTTAALSSVLTIPAGATRYFRVVGDISNAGGTTGSAGTVTTKIVGDTAYPSLASLMGQYATGVGNFVWSPVSTTTAVTTNLDWTNGYQLSGLPSGGMDSFTLTK